MPEQTNRLSEIRAREEAASEGPWGRGVDRGVVTDNVDQPVAVFGGSKQDYADAEFTAHARQDVPWLLEQLEQARRIAVALEQKNARLTAEKAELDKVCDEVMRERDGLHDALDQFAQAVAPEDVIGEHSSGNNPWANALDLVTPMAEVDKLREQNAELEKALGLNEAAAA